MLNRICRVCKKPLKNITSVKYGMGPVCRAKDKINLELDLFPHSNFTIQKTTDDYIYIKDAGGNSKSITNDAEYVLSILVREYGLGKRRLFYIDTMGHIDEIKHNGNGHFTGFKSGHMGIEL